MPRPRELFQLVDRFDDDTDSSVTSTRLPTVLHDAARLAVELGMDASVNDATNRALRDRVEVFAQQLALEEHYRRHPGSRPSLVQLALAAARLDGDPIAEQPALLEQAAREMAARWPDATGDDVLVYASALAHHRKPARPRGPAA